MKDHRKKKKRLTHNYIGQNTIQLQKVLSEMKLRRNERPRDWTGTVWYYTGKKNIKPHKYKSKLLSKIINKYNHN